MTTDGQEETLTDEEYVSLVHRWAAVTTFHGPQINRQHLRQSLIWLVGLAKAIRASAMDRNARKTALEAWAQKREGESRPEAIERFIVERFQETSDPSIGETFLPVVAMLASDVPRQAMERESYCLLVATLAEAVGITTRLVLETYGDGAYFQTMGVYYHDRPRNRWKPFAFCMPPENAAPLTAQLTLLTESSVGMSLSDALPPAETPPAPSAT